MEVWYSPSGLLVWSRRRWQFLTYYGHGRENSTGLCSNIAFIIVWVEDECKRVFGPEHALFLLAGCRPCRADGLSNDIRRRDRQRPISCSVHLRWRVCVWCFLRARWCAHPPRHMRTATPRSLVAGSSCSPSYLNRQAASLLTAISHERLPRPCCPVQSRSCRLRPAQDRRG